MGWVIRHHWRLCSGQQALVQLQRGDGVHLTGGRRLAMRVAPGLVRSTMPARHMESAHRFGRPIGSRPPPGRLSLRGRWLSPASGAHQAPARRLAGEAGHNQLTRSLQYGQYSRPMPAVERGDQVSGHGLRSAVASQLEREGSQARALTLRVCGRSAPFWPDGS